MYIHVRTIVSSSPDSAFKAFPSIVYNVWLYGRAYELCLLTVRKGIYSSFCSWDFSAFHCSKL